MAFDIYRASENNRARFVLGKSGSSPIIVVGLNPSIATREKSDLTATKIERISKTNGFDGFVIVNLYPQRSTDPANLHKRCSKTLIDSNLIEIESVFRAQRKLTVWAAWGTGILARRYLLTSFVALNDLLIQFKGQWWHYGERTADGHPRHPSRVSYNKRFTKFDSARYALQLNQS
ncbi:MAG: DUF1643 domain-containing protein [Pseudomonadota bacterium]